MNIPERTITRARAPSRTVIVGTPRGLHGRPAARFVAAAAAQPVPVRIRAGDRAAVPAHSMLCLLSLGVRGGTEVILEADGDGADAALDALASLLAEDLDEMPEPSAPQAVTG